MGAWSQEQVLALAPDSSSAKSGKDLAANRKKWVTLASAEGTIWGECQGSGAKPYQTQVELNGPAFHCSCPSRKFPCKHGLGLLLLFANQPAAFSAAAPPAWVTSWLEGRAKRAEQKAAKEQAKQERLERGEPAVDSASKQKREAARAAKVNAGLEELSLWLADLVRRGLGAIRNEPPSFWDERARRLIDAQAPGLARRVLQVAALPMTGAGWQDALLERLSRLHLLVEAYRRLDRLPTDAQADARTAIGFPIDQDEVRSGPGLKDVWQVVGQSVEIEERLRVQRTWLVGRGTGRPALLLDFTPLTQPKADLGLPAGMAVEAELAYFPSSFPLRALIKQRLGPTEPLAEPTCSTGIAEVLAAYADALARNPWLELIPAVLKDVVVLPREEGWAVRNPWGAVLPLSPRFEHGWELLAVSGGRPFLLTGEFDGATLRPLAAVVGGTFRPLPLGEAEARPLVPPPLGGPDDLVKTWQEAITSALVGVERRPAAIAGDGGPFAVAARRLDGQEPAARLLGVAALASQYGRTGHKPVTDPSRLPEPCDLDDLPECGPSLVWQLQQMLGNTHADVLPEWFGLVALKGRRVSDETLVDVLNLGRRQSDLRPLIAPVLGRRGRWLARWNPEWAYVGGEADRDDPATVWQTGTRPERLVAMRQVRESNPDHARVLLESTWEGEPADNRAAFVEVLQSGLSMADEPFLEAALDDRAKTVRSRAADLLARLPESRLVARMTDRARLLIGVGSGDPIVLRVTPPRACDAAMVRDGVEAKVTPEAKRRNIGERAWWLAQVVAAVPPRHWSSTLSHRPDTLAEAAARSEWAVALFQGWAHAALRHRDPEWAAVLLRHQGKKSDRFRNLSAQLGLLLPPDVREALILEQLQGEPGPLRAEHPAFHLLSAIEEPIGPELAREILRRARQLCDMKKSAYDPSLWQLLPTLGQLAPPALADEIETLWPGDVAAQTFGSHLVDQLKSTLRFRRDMHEEFAR